MNNRKTSYNIDRFLNFAEELAWLMNNYKGLKIEENITKIRSLIAQDENLLSCNSSMRSLVGIFPELFQNKKLFPSNQSIIEFANEVLNMKLNPNKNRSKTEIIGEIVCTTYSLSSNELNKVIKALNKIADDDNMVKSIENMKKNELFSWNEIINKLGSNQ